MVRQWLRAQFGLSLMNFCYQISALKLTHSPFPCITSPLMLSRPFFRDSSVLVFTQTGFNVFGHQFAKPYHHQHGICAEVIHHLRLHETHQGS